MAGIQKSGSLVKVQRAGNDQVYGNGADGDVTISGTVTLTSDKYYNSLTVPLGTFLYTAGFRVFVKTTAVINGVVGVCTLTGNSAGVSNGTITSPGSLVSTGTAPGHTNSSITYRLGGEGGGATSPGTSVLPSFLVKKFEALTGTIIDATYASTPIALAGGSKGTTGTVGTTTAIVTGTWPGKSGAAGAAGGHPTDSGTVGAAGGRGATGADGTTTGATAGTGGAGGAGAAGGAVVILIAKTITGTGTVASLGMIGTAGSAGATPAAPAPAPTQETPPISANAAFGANAEFENYKPNSAPAAWPRYSNKETNFSAGSSVITILGIYIDLLVILLIFFP